ncbi:BolA family transcriptional regulator [Pseudovibrio sp. FO-BEG1]|uniref:BolA family protein n=1 Tax=Pseudovibrio sp. (strain FO-BEG1) TaxID=911045 RepID=UPI0002E1C10A|nr:BolA family protein [Pseudovibrio sp. FO-BEG1]
MSTRDIMITKLEAAFKPQLLEVTDESESHRGHGGWREGGQTHFRIKIISTAFEGMSRVAMHRAVNDCVAEEIAGGIHALAIEAKSH